MKKYTPERCNNNKNNSKRVRINGKQEFVCVFGGGGVLLGMALQTAETFLEIKTSENLISERVQNTL